MKFQKSFVLPPLILGIVVAGVFTLTNNNLGLSIAPNRGYNQGMMTKSNITTLDMAQESTGMMYAEPDMMQVESKIGIMPPYYQDDRVSNSAERYYNSNASINLEVKEIEQATIKVRETLEKGFDAMLDNYYMNDDKNYSNAYMTFRVPEQKLMTATMAIKALGYEVIGQSINVDDVTVQVEDQETNLEYNKDYYDREIDRLMLELDNKELTAMRKLQIENQIKNYQEQITRLEQGVDEYKQGLSYATLSINITKDNGMFSKFLSGDFGNGFLGDLARSGGSAFRALGLLIGLIVHLIVWTLVFSIVWAPIWLLIRATKNKQTKTE